MATGEPQKAGDAADYLDAIGSLRAAMAVMSDAAVEAAECAVAAAQSHLAALKSMRAAMQSYDNALMVLTTPADRRQ